MKERKIVLTGFGAFNGVPSNPTTELVEWVAENKAELSEGLDVTCQVLETSMKGVQYGLASLLAEVEKDGVDPDQCVWVHLGVHGGSDRMRLESRAFNEADFRCPDEQGESPRHKPIDPGSRTSKMLYTRLDLDGLCSKAREFSECPVSVTGDPGRFVCNYCYYSSLLQNKNALFIHVPPFQVINKEVQLDFLKGILSNIHDYLIANLKVPEWAMESMQQMGFQETEMLRAMVAVNAGESPDAFDAALNWLLENEGKQSAPLETYEDLHNLRFSAVEELKMVVVVNSSLAMSTGKIASQVAHAALGLQRALNHSQPALLDQWQEDNEPLIVCKCSQDGLSNIVAMSQQLGVPCFPVADAGRTQVAPGSITAIAVGPGKKSEVDRITGSLALL